MCPASFPVKVNDNCYKNCEDNKVWWEVPKADDPTSMDWLVKTVDMRRNGNGACVETCWEIVAGAPVAIADCMIFLGVTYTQWSKSKLLTEKWWHYQRFEPTELYNSFNKHVDWSISSYHDGVHCHKECTKVLRATMPFCQNKEIKACADFGYKDCKKGHALGCSIT